MERSVELPRLDIRYEGPTVLSKDNVTNAWHGGRQTFSKLRRRNAGRAVEKRAKRGVFERNFLPHRFFR